MTKMLTSLPAGGRELGVSNFALNKGAKELPVLKGHSGLWDYL